MQRLDSDMQNLFKVSGLLSNLFLKYVLNKKDYLSSFFPVNLWQ